MKRIHISALAAGAALLATSLSSCESVLDKRNLGAIDESLIFNDSTLAQLNVDYIYDQNLPGWFGMSGQGLGNVNPAILSEEGAGESKYFEGTVTTNDVTDIGTGLSTSNHWAKIRVINTFMQAVRKGTIKPASKNRLLAQAYFFRAWRNYDLVRIYGGIPIVRSTIYAVGDDARSKAYIGRSSTTETFDFIKSDLDSAIMFLPGKWGTSADWGRITRGAAAALKARALLTAASPQFNPNDDQAKWQAANAASLQAQDLLLKAGFGLHASYDQLWFQETNNPEAVMITGYNNSTGDQVRKNNTYDNSTRPAYTGTSGGSNQPTWDLVQAYPMLDGKKPGESTKYAYDPQFFYKNRDPRFGKTIAYNGQAWPLNGNSSYKIWTYLDASNKSAEPLKPTNTGFYLRKAINTSVSASDAPYVGTDWIEIRYAEVLLNLAETACGVNDLNTAYTQLKAIRKRAGIEAGADGNYGLKAGMSRAEMFDAILYENQIEFAWEGKRFWDLRRWKKIESTLNGKKREGVTIKLKSTGVPADFATTRDNVPIDVAYTYFTVTPKVLDTKYAINWKPEYYYFGIPSNTIDNNPSIQQTMGWNSGTFDPLK